MVVAIVVLVLGFLFVMIIGHLAAKEEDLRQHTDGCPFDPECPCVKKPNQ